jgi:hypothetical protein
MKKLLLLPLSVCAFLFSFAQNYNFVVFSMDGDAFTVIVNGERMNTSPVTNLKVTDLVQPSNKVKIIFAEAGKNPIEKTVYGEPAMEYTMEVKKDKKGEMVMRLVSQVALAQAAPAPASQTVVVWGAPAPVATTTTVVKEETITTTSGVVPVNGAGTSVTTSETSTGGSDNFSMNMNVDGMSMNVNINAGENGMGTTINDGSGTTTMGTDVAVISTTTTTTTTTSGGWTDPSGGAVATTQNTAGNCYGMSEYDFTSLQNSITSKTFEDSKMTTAKQALRSNCMTADQVKATMGLFTYEENKLDFAKFAYDYCPDKQNYYKVNDAFGFETTIEELDQYIQSKR